MSEKYIYSMNVYCNRASCGKLTQHDVFKRIDNNHVVYVYICNECGHSKINLLNFKEE